MEETHHALEQSTKQQSSSSKWQASRVGRLTASHFSDVLLRRSLLTDAFINSFFDVKDYTSLPAQLSHGCHNETKARNIYVSDTGFVVGLCGLVVNPLLPWPGDGKSCDLMVGHVTHNSQHQRPFPTFCVIHVS